MRVKSNKQSTTFSSQMFKPVPQVTQPHEQRSKSVPADSPSKAIDIKSTGRNRRRTVSDSVVDKIKDEWLEKKSTVNIDDLIQKFPTPLTNDNLPSGLETLSELKEAFTFLKEQEQKQSEVLIGTPSERLQKSYFVILKQMNYVEDVISEFQNNIYEAKALNYRSTPPLPNSPEKSLVKPHLPISAFPIGGLWLTSTDKCQAEVLPTQEYELHVGSSRSGASF